MPRSAVLALATLLALPTAAVAERWYRVEVVVFSYPAFFEALGEDPPYVRVPDLYDVVDLETPGEEDDADEAAATEPGPAPGAEASVDPAMTEDAGPAGDGAAGDDEAGPPFPAFTVLPESELTLTPVTRRLERSSGYAPILHVAWMQPAYGSTGSRKVRITDRPPEDQNLDAEPVDTMVTTSEDLAAFTTDGFARLRVGRTLNLDLDLYHQTEAAAIRLSESRRVRFRELHYFDHPGLGAIVQVLPVEFGDGSAEP